MGLVRGINSYEHFLLLQKTRGQFTVPVSGNSQPLVTSGLCGHAYTFGTHPTIHVDKSNFKI